MNNEKTLTLYNYEQCTILHGINRGPDELADSAGIDLRQMFLQERLPVRHDRDRHIQQVRDVQKLAST